MINRLLFVCGCGILFQAALMLLPLVQALLVNDSRAVGAFVFALVLAALTGAGLFFGFRGHHGQRTAAYSISMPLCILICGGVFSAGPFYFFEPDSGVIVALFEAFSFLTTNGASAYAAMDQSSATHLWRAVLAFEGGFFAICYALTILTSLNSGAMQLHQSPLGLGDSKGYVRIFRVAASLAPFYLYLFLAATAVFLILGEAPVQAFAAAVAGLSTSALPFLDPGSFSGPALWVFMLLVLIGASNLDMIYAFATGHRRNILRDPEARSFLMMWLGASFIIMAATVVAVGHLPFTDILFEVLSMLSGLGLSVEPGGVAALFEGSTIWLSLVFLALMVMGGGAASSAGGLGQLRFRVLGVVGRGELRRLAHPSGTHILRVGKVFVSEQDVEAMWLLLGSFAIALVVGTLFLGISGLSVSNALILALSNLSLAGPGASLISADIPGYSGLTSLEYGTLTFLMIVGRVEASLILALLSRSFWNR